MALQQITEADLAGKGVQPLADVPGLPADEMKQKFEELVREVVIPAVNQHAQNGCDRAEIAQLIANAVFATGAADMRKSVYDPAGHEEDIFAWAMPRSLYDPGGQGTDIFAALNAAGQALGQQAATAQAAADAAQASADAAMTEATGAQNKANAAMPRAGGDFAGRVSTINNADDAGWTLRNIHVQTSGGAGTNTNRILMRRK